MTNQEILGILKSETAWLPLIFMVGDNDGAPVLCNQLGDLCSREQVEAMRQLCASHLKQFKSEFAIEEFNARLDWLRSRSKEPEQKQDKKAKPGFVYLMKNNRNGMVKIGWSKDPRHREKTLCSEEPEIHMIAISPGSIQDEKAIHTEYDSCRVRGEGFRLSESQVDDLSKRLRA